MWFINFVLGSAVAVTLLVLGTSAYVDHSKSAEQQVSTVVPIPRAAPRPPKLQAAVADADDETVHEPKASKAIKVRHRRQDTGRRSTW